MLSSTKRFMFLNLVILLILSPMFSRNSQAQDFLKLSNGKVSHLELINRSFLGSWKRNYYGDQAPGRLDLIWKFYLGKGKTIISRKIGEKEWAGSGWTGQALLVRENDQLFLVHGALDHHLRKIDAASGELKWQYQFDDVIKGTGTLWVNEKAENLEESVLILQGSRRGYEKDLYSKNVPSFRAVSYFTGKELWRLNVTRTPSYSRDVDGSALTLGDVAYIGLENALFTVLNPDPRQAKQKDGMLQPQIYQQIPLYERADQYHHGGNLVVESSPALLDGIIYITAGSGHVYGYDIKMAKLVWDFYIGSDMDGSAVVTDDHCLLVPVEKQYIEGKGGVFKLDPAKPAENAVVWYFPVEDDSVESWQGGVIGSVGINDLTKQPSDPNLCAFIGIDGFLYVLNYKEIDQSAGKQSGPNNKKTFPLPKIVFKKEIGPSISTPIIVGNKLIASGYKGLYLFEFDQNFNFKLLASSGRCSFESTAIVHEKKLYIGGRDGYLYCFGEK
jgi:outer membrane protein assembly factor BamB